MLTDNEEELIEDIGDLMRRFKGIQYDVIYKGRGFDDWGYEEYNDVFIEVEFHIHALQNMVMAISAAREHSQFRFFGVVKIN